MIPAYKGANLLIPENVDFNYHLAQSRDQWNKLYKEEEPELAPPVGQENEDTSNDGLRGVLHLITLSHFA
ncbi:hypothetical protein PCASD_11073 [Puccinia coronata f. sp. avenae]|uniref:Uncharacterized protein n=1 Tax=Puccinia coronata f. sp. avenae TaxID=200324 RepID=A0A2N5U0F7_9BASI|nr:hypothetical protein PCASD_11073 [Puccinia coronata f. sp. avenae]